MDVFSHVGLRIMEGELDSEKHEAINHAEVGYKQVERDKKAVTYRKVQPH